MYVLDMSAIERKQENLSPFVIFAMFELLWLSFTSYQAGIEPVHVAVTTSMFINALHKWWSTCILRTDEEWRDLQHNKWSSYPEKSGRVNNGTTLLRRQKKWVSKRG